MSSLTMERARMDRLARYGLEGHPDDRFWARVSDLSGIGTLRVADQRAGSLQVEIYCNGVVVYLDTTNVASVGDLANLSRIAIGSGVAFSGAVRTLDSRGVRMGRLLVEPCEVMSSKAVLTPSIRHSGVIEFGEISIEDPSPSSSAFFIVPGAARPELLPVGAQ